MGTTRFMFSDQLRGVPATLKNGMGGGAPGRIEDLDFPMENAIDRDRYVVWSSGASPPDPTNADWGFAIDNGVAWAALANRRVPGAGLTQFTLQYQTGVYTPGGSWTNLHTPVEVGGTSPKRNAFVQFNDTTVRSLRWRLIGNGSFTTKLWAGGLANIVDLGVIASPGLVETPIHPRTEEMTPEGAKHVLTHGSVYRRFSLPFEEAHVALFNQIRLAVLETRSFLLLTHEDELYEVIVAAETAEVLLSARSTPEALRTVTLMMEEQP